MPFEESSTISESAETRIPTTEREQLKIIKEEAPKGIQQDENLEALEEYEVAKLREQARQKRIQEDIELAERYGESVAAPNKKERTSVTEPERSKEVFDAWQEEFGGKEKGGKESKTAPERSGEVFEAWKEKLGGEPKGEKIIEEKEKAEKTPEDILDENRRKFAKVDFETGNKFKKIAEKLGRKDLLSGKEKKEVRDWPDAQDAYLKSLRDYREHLLDKKREELKNKGLGAEEIEREVGKYAKDIVKETVVDEANKLYDAKTDIKIEAKPDKPLKESIKKNFLKAANWYRKLPLRYKLLTSAGLIAGGMGAGALGGATGVALASGLVAGKWFQRVFGGAATAVGLEGLIQRSQEKQARKRTEKEFGEVFGDNLLEAIQRNDEAIDDKLFKIEKKKNWEKNRRYVLAGTAGLLVGSGFVAKAFANVMGEAGELWHKAKDYFGFIEEMSGAPTPPIPPSGGPSMPEVPPGPEAATPPVFPPEAHETLPGGGHETPPPTAHTGMEDAGKVKDAFEERVEDVYGPHEAPPEAGPEGTPEGKVLAPERVAEEAYKERVKDIYGGGAGHEAPSGPSGSTPEGAPEIGPQSKFPPITSEQYHTGTEGAGAEETWKEVPKEEWAKPQEMPKAGPEIGTPEPDLREEVMEGIDTKLANDMTAHQAEISQRLAEQAQNPELADVPKMQTWEVAGLGGRDSLWKMIAHQMEMRYGDDFTALDAAHKTYIIDALKDRVGEHPESFGLTDIDNIQAGQQIEFSPLFEGDEAKGFLVNTLGDAGELSPEEAADIIKNNETLNEYTKTHPGEWITTEKTQQILTGHEGVETAAEVKLPAVGDQEFINKTAEFEAMDISGEAGMQTTQNAIFETAEKITNAQNVLENQNLSPEAQRVLSQDIITQKEFLDALQKGMDDKFYEDPAKVGELLPKKIIEEAQYGGMVDKTFEALSGTERNQVNQLFFKYLGNDFSHFRSLPSEVQGKYIGEVGKMIDSLKTGAETTSNILHKTFKLRNLTELKMVQEFWLKFKL